ncbi:MAG TPA: ABC transporter substrate-binding protein [Stackebrandtia sp.]|uniref:ABC transporter substrate-binding protein n=1 Tax=Stackebrandtia sp. TaxID=2023065 RepID=UPI002D31920B|nr:ABC transporter substrate-binding protein [Stackebrandtia sp.]HZE40178.1 ABC transporter substrate-binding protein [Stackebrandtia sp.]
MSQPPVFPQQPPAGPPPGFPPPGFAPPPPPRRSNAGVLLGSAGIVFFAVVVAVVILVVMNNQAEADRPHATVLASEIEAHSDTRLKVAEYRVYTDLLPGNAYAGEQSSLISAMYAGLTRSDPDSGEPEPRVARDWKTDDGTKWTITLKSGYTFQNGEKVTAKSFMDAWNFNVKTDNKQTNQQLYKPIKGYKDAKKSGKLSGVEAPDDHTLVVTLDEPIPDFPSLLAHPAFYPMAAACLDDTSACGRTPIGDGPFKPTGDIAGGATASLDRWADYAGDKPQYAGIDVTYYDTPDKLQVMIASDGVDVGQTSYTSDSSSGGQAEDFPANTMSSLVMPDSKGYKDPKFRQAISLALDRQELASTFNYKSKPATSFTPPAALGSAKDSCGNCTGDKEKAKQLLDDSKWKKSKTFKLSVFDYQSQWGQAACAEIQDALGLTCEVRSIPSSDYGKIDASKTKTALLWSWAGDYGTSNAFLSGFYVDSLKVKDSKYTKLLDAANKHSTVKEAADGYAKAEARLDDFLPAIPLVTDVTSVLHADRVLSESVSVDLTTGGVQLDLLQVKRT